MPVREGASHTSPARKPIRCWEYFSCQRTDCPSYGEGKKACWLADHCPCPHNSGLELADKGVICIHCPVFEHSDDIEAVKAFVRKRYNALMAREHLANERNAALNDAFLQMTEVIEKLCLGDIEARMELTTKNPLLRRLQDGLNTLAESLGEYIAESHEIAIGICEHYEALRRIAAGELAVKASEGSPNEIIAQLGILINKGTAALTGKINQLKLADEELNFAHHQMRDLIDLLPDATFVVDRDANIIVWNKAMEEMSGKSKEEMLGNTASKYSLYLYREPRPILLNFLDKEIKEIEEYYHYVKRVGEKLFAEARITREGEADAYLWVTAAPLIDRAGNRIGAVESLRDISELRRSEEGRLNLEHQLRHSQKMEAIGLLAGGVAHDFNNLLTGIIGYTSLLKTRIEPNSPLQHYLDQITMCTDLAAKLIRDLLTFSRKKALNPEMVNLNEVILKIRGLLSRVLTEDISFDLQLGEEPLLVLADKAMVEQVLLNLVVNARDAMHHGGSLTITSAVEHHPAVARGKKRTRYATVSVIDTGCGMDPETKEKIFEPFFTTKEMGQGTGLGLSTVYGIVSQHDGFIDVESEPGRGSTFKICLPLLEQDQCPPAQPAEPGSFSLKPCGDETVLIVEDDSAAQHVKSEILTLAGYRVITADDGAEAVRCYQEQGKQIDIIVMDVIMPVMNGRDAYEEIRRINPEVRCLFTSGYDAELIHRKGRIDPSFDFLPKPCTPNELLSAIRSILDRP